MSTTTISPQELHRLRQQGQDVDLIDVRSSMEFHAGHAEGAIHLPLQQVTPEAVQSLRKGPASAPVYVICHSGGRSQAACDRLSAAGMPHVVNVVGGTSAWKSAGLPVVREPGSWRRYVRPVGVLLVALALILTFTVHPYFSIGAIVAWVGMIIASGGSCPLACALSSYRRTKQAQSCCSK